MFEPLKITAYPRVGIQCDEYLPIDGILYAAAMRLKHGPEILTTPGQATDAESILLPLDCREKDGEWFYAASFAQWEAPHTDGQSFWVKRFDPQHSDLVDFRGKRGKVIVEQGRYKAYHMPIYYRHALEVSWYVVGDKSQIERLLQIVTHIGKKTAQGNGRINRWCVESWPADCSLRNDAGKPMRAIPQSGGILYGIRPSYWDSKNQVECQLP